MTHSELLRYLWLYIVTRHLKCIAVQVGILLVEASTTANLIFRNMNTNAACKFIFSLSTLCVWFTLQMSPRAFFPRPQPIATGARLPRHPAVSERSLCCNLGSVTLFYIPILQICLTFLAYLLSAYDGWKLRLHKYCSNIPSPDLRDESGCFLIEPWGPEQMKGK